MKARTNANGEDHISTLTPARRQYLTLKEQYPDAILFFQVGDFYETFDDDARLVARDAEVHLTSKDFGRSGRIPLAGVPVRALDTYLRRLLAKGHRVAVCEQISEAGHGLVERTITRIVTPGTLIEPQLLRERENTYLAAVNFGRDSAALAYVDVSTGEFAVAPFIGPEREAALAAELVRLNPAEILVPPDAPPLPGERQATPRERAPFDGEDGIAALKGHFGVASLEAYGCQDLPLACGAAATILDYLREYNARLLAGLRGLATYHTGDYMTLDGQTRRNLELMRSGRTASGGRGLLGVLDRSCTAGGGRLLRRWLSQPLLDLAALAARHDAVAEFVEQTAARLTARAALNRIGDLERLTGRMVAGTSSPRELHNLRLTLGVVPELRAALEGLDTDVVATLRERLDPCAEVAEVVERAIAGVQEGRRIRPGYDAELDGLIDGIRDARLWIAELERRERERTKIKSLKVGYNKIFGYYLEITNPNLSLVPPEYIRKQTLTSCERYITPELKEFEARIADAEGQINAVEEAIYLRVLGELAEQAPRLLATAAAIAQLDVVAALAEVAERQGYVRPIMDAGRALHIRAGRHPTVEAAVERHTFIPNDVDLDADELDGAGAIMLLTGPNMAGKSTYLRQVALIVLMAQIGAFVPATEAHLGLTDRIFTRVGAQDDLAAGQSTFMVEMLETAAILHHATPRSLIILDEIGRGTGTLDGLAIARAVIEDIHDRIGARCLFATHYHELLGLLDRLPRLRACNVTVREDEDGIVFLHRIAPGGAARSYGIHVARLAGVPRSVTERAALLLRDLEATATPLRQVSETPGEYNATNGHAPPPPAIPVDADCGADGAMLHEIAALDLVNTTPLEAINLLFSIQQRLRAHR
ncbi:MAG TPA: DNA mismatch repair protein MutS [Thermomicrobiales bacterium]|jgi:DNA mismatch repair protein MutS